MDGASAADVADAVQTVWEYHHLHHKLPPRADGIMCLCSSDIGVAKHAAKLFQTGKYVIIIAIVVWVGACVCVCVCSRLHPAHIMCIVFHSQLPKELLAHLIQPRITHTLFRYGWLLFSGGVGTGPHSGANMLGWDRPEACYFRDAAIECGVPREAIITEEARCVGAYI